MVRLALLVCVLALAATACGAKPTNTAGTQTSTESAVSTVETSPATSTTPTPTAPGTARCTAGTLSGMVKPQDAGAGNRYATLVVTNKSKSACTLYGYGGLQLVDAQGNPTPTNLVRTGDPSPSLVILQSSETAQKKLHWTVVPTGDEPVTGPCEPPSAGAKVIPPDETEPFSVTFAFGSVCAKGRIEGGAYAKP